jgi:subtilisin family serine protease
MAAPHVAGLAALIKSAQPAWTAAQIKTHIEKTADDLGAPGFDPEFGHGRINVRRALSEALGRR